MSTSPTRRDLLRAGTVLSVAGTAAAVSGCDLLSTTPGGDKRRRAAGGARRARGAREAPMLATRVRAGKLPPLRDRLPKQPAVVKPLQQPGEYGGTIRMATTVESASQLLIVAREGLVEWAPGATDVVPALARSWDRSADGKVYTFHLREGARWSDGHPFTADDLMFYFDSILSNTELTPAFPTWLQAGGKPVRISKVDRYTVRFAFEAPNGLLLRQLAYVGAFQGSILHPRHYLRQFHPDYTAKDDLEAAAKDAGFDGWASYFLAKNAVADNPDRPVMGPWRLTEPMTGGKTRAVAERNPFYWKVDTQGRQLPYVDTLTQDKQDPNVITLRAASGDLDIQFETLGPADLPTLVRSQKSGGFRVLHWASDAPWIAMYMNQSDKDPVIRQLMQDIDFRAGLSYAINRDDMNRILYSGTGGNRHPCAVPEDDYYVKGTGERFTEHDPAKANQLLDKVGLTQRDARGFRLRPDGKPLRLLITTFTFEYGGTSNAVDAYGLVKKYWQDVGVDTDFASVSGSLWSQRATGNLLDIPGYTVAGILWDVDPLWYVPVSESTYWAPAFGQWYATGGKEGEEPPPAIRRLQQLYDRMKVTGDEAERLRLGRQILAEHDRNVWMIGTVTTPMAPVIANADLVNVLEKAVLSYRLQFTATSWMEQMAYRNPEQH